MPRVLHIGKFFPPFFGGIENFLADLMPVQNQQPDHRVAALVHDHRSQFGRFFAAVQAENDCTQIVYRAPCYGRLLYAPVSPQFPFWLRQTIRQFQPDILHIHLPNTSAFWLLGFLKLNIPWVIHWHADVVSQSHTLLTWAYTGYRPLEYRLLARAQAIIVTSPPYLTSSTALQPWLAKCHVVPLGLASTRLPLPAMAQQLWAEQHWLPQKVRILCVGRLTYYKGHEILLQAMAQVTDAQLLIVGQGELQSRLKKQIDKQQINHVVKLLGHCTPTKLTALLASCDCFCLPSLERTEAFGVALLEAMRYAKPVIASAIPGSGVTWVVQDHQTGLLVPPRDSNALAAALQYLIDQPTQRQRMGKVGYQRFLQTFDITPVAKSIAQVYQTLY